MRQLTILRAHCPEYKNVHVDVLQDVIKRLNRSFENFFYSGFGFPRFKGMNRYDSFRFKKKGYTLDGNRLSLSKIGNVKVRLSRTLPVNISIKTCTVKREVSGWFVTLSFKYSPVPLPTNNLRVGIDVGVENFAALSDGSTISNPRHYECGQAELRKAQRRVSRRKQDSHRRGKAVLLLRKVNARIANRRNDFLQKITTALIKKFGVIVVENLNVKGLAQGILSKQVHDAGWGTFFRMLDWKAEEAVTRRVLIVPAPGTSQECPVCGNKKKKLLSQRKHRCSICGLILHRDIAAAQVILARAEPLSAKIGEVIPCLA